MRTNPSSQLVYKGQSQFPVKGLVWPLGYLGNIASKQLGSLSLTYSFRLKKGRFRKVVFLMEKSVQYPKMEMEKNLKRLIMLCNADNADR